MLGVTPLRNGQSHGLLGNMHLLGEARLQTMFNDGGKGSGTSEDLAIEERMRIAVEGIVVVDLEVFDGGAETSEETASDDLDAAESEPSRSTRGGFVKKRSAGSQPRVVSGFMTARARVTSRSMWTDEGRLLANLRDAAERSVEDLEGGARLSAVERTAATAVRFACRNYCNKRPDIIVVAHRGVPDADARAAADGGGGRAGIRAWHDGRLRHALPRACAHGRRRPPACVRSGPRTGLRETAAAGTGTCGRIRRTSDAVVRTKRVRRVFEKTRAGTRRSAS